MESETNDIIKRALIQIRAETKNYIEAQDYSDEFQAKVLAIFELVVANNHLEPIADYGFEDCIDSYVDEFESS